jgi:3,4-dihydroxy 2-butanone 4-phosphate synthase
MKEARLPEAISALKRGEFVLVFDSEDREGETDFVALASKVTPSHIREMRVHGGGLIFLMVHHNVAEQFGLPFLTSLYSSAGKDHPVLGALVPNDIPYDTKSSFSLTINHRKTFTGVTDNDRALTVRRFCELATEVLKTPEKDQLRLLGAEFRSPGHVPICRSSARPLTDRFGHTELTVALAMMARETPVLVGCEMMGNDGKALSRGHAMRYAKEHGLVFLEGKEIISAFHCPDGKTVSA